jgi:hypothetical protein
MKTYVEVEAWLHAFLTHTRCSTEHGAYFCRIYSDRWIPKLRRNILFPSSVLEYDLKMSAVDRPRRRKLPECTIRPPGQPQDSLEEKGQGTKRLRLW